MSWDTNPRHYPPDLFYGNRPLDIRFKSGKGGKRQYFCLNNRTLHLTDNDFIEGTFEAGKLLGSFCTEHCVPERAQSPHEPCPAFAASYKVGTNKEVVP